MSTAIKWPPEFESDGALLTLDGDKEKKKRLRFQILTILREVLYTEDGSEVAYSLFNPNDDATNVIIEDQIRQMLKRSATDILPLRFNFSYNKSEQDSNERNDFIRVVMFFRDKITQQPGEVAVDIPLPGG